MTALCPVTWVTAQGHRPVNKVGWTQLCPGGPLHSGVLRPDMEPAWPGAALLCHLKPACKSCYFSRGRVLLGAIRADVIEVTRSFLQVTTITGSGSGQ